MEMIYEIVQHKARVIEEVSKWQRLLLSFLTLAVRHAVVVVVGVGSDSIFEETLAITGARDQGIADHTVLSFKHGRLLRPAPPQIPSKLGIVVAGLEELPDKAFRFTDGPYFPDQALTQQTLFHDGTT